MQGVLRLYNCKNVQISGTDLVSALMLKVANGHLLKQRMDTYLNKMTANAANIKGLMY